MVIFTSWSKLASLSLKSVAFDASTVKIFCVPSPLENVSPLKAASHPSEPGAAPFAALDKQPICVRDTRQPSDSPAAMPPPPTSAHISPLRFFSYLQLSKISKECIEDGCSFGRRRELSRGFSGRRIRQDPDIRRRDAVALGIFHQVHSLVGQVQQTLLGSRIHRIGRHAH